MSENSPGRAAYEAVQRAFPDEDWRPWDMLDGDGHEGWEAAAQAAIDAAEADGRTVPLAKFGEVVADVQSLRAERDRARERITALETERDERWPRCPDGCGCRLGTEDADASECACEGPCCDECRENGYPDADPVHLMTIEMSAWCGASGPGNGRASSQWRDVTCPACLAKGMEHLRALVWDMLQTMPPSHTALGFALTAGRLGVTDEQGRPLAMACAHGEDGV